MNKRIFELSVPVLKVNGVTCRDPKIDWETPSCGDITCELSNGAIRVELPEGCENECFYVNVSCDNGDCQDCTSKRLKVCPCTLDSECDECERCENNVCVSQCPDDKFCDNDTCVDCSQDNHCPGGQICFDGGCQCPPDKPNLNDRGICVACTEDDCGPCERCTEDGCVPVECPVGVCDPSTGTCVECNNTEDCGEFKICVEGRCECINGLIPDGNGNCIPRPECERDVECPPCYACVAGECQPIQCPGDTVCYNGTCVPRCNCDDALCPPGRGCNKINNFDCVCLPCEGTCADNIDCGDGCYCVDGACQKSPCDSVYCVTGDECGFDCGCENGQCYPCSGGCAQNGDCGDGCYCFNGQCTGNPCDTAVCDSPDDCGQGCGCTDGKCYPCSGSCANNGDCGDGCVCINGNCSPNPCENVACVDATDCGEGCGCLNGICYPCDSLDCFGGQYLCDEAKGCDCWPGSCVPNDCGNPCSSYGDCAEGCACVDGFCIDCSKLSCSDNSCADHPSCACIDGACMNNPDCTNADIKVCNDATYQTKTDCTKVSIVIDQSGGIKRPDGLYENDIEESLNQWLSDVNQLNPNNQTSVVTAGNSGNVSIGMGQQGVFSSNAGGYSNFTDAFDKGFGELSKGNTTQCPAGVDCEQANTCNCEGPNPSPCCNEDRYLVLFSAGQQNEPHTPTGGNYPNSGVTTNGVSTGQQNQDLETIADRARACGIEVIVVAYGEQALGNESYCATLDRIANGPDSSDPNRPDNLILVPQATANNNGVNGTAAAAAFDELTNRIARTKTGNGGCVPAQLGEGGCECDCIDSDDDKNHVCIPGQGCTQITSKSEYPNLPRVTKEECCEECNSIQYWYCPGDGNECIPSDTPTSNTTEAQCNLQCKCCVAEINGVLTECGGAQTITGSVSECSIIFGELFVIFTDSAGNTVYSGTVSSFSGGLAPGGYTVTYGVANNGVIAPDCQSTIQLNVPGEPANCCSEVNATLSNACREKGSAEVTFNLAGSGPFTSITATIGGNPVNVNNNGGSYSVFGTGTQLAVTVIIDGCEKKLGAFVTEKTPPPPVVRCELFLPSDICDGANSYTVSAVLNMPVGSYDLKIRNSSGIIGTQNGVNGAGSTNITISGTTASSGEIIYLDVCAAGDTTPLCESNKVLFTVADCTEDFTCTINEPICEGENKSINITTNSNETYTVTVTGDNDGTYTLNGGSTSVPIDTSTPGGFSSGITIVNSVGVTVFTSNKNYVVTPACDAPCFDCNGDIASLNVTSPTLQGNSAVISLAPTAGLNYVPGSAVWTFSPAIAHTVASSELVVTTNTTAPAGTYSVSVTAEFENAAGCTCEVALTEDFEIVDCNAACGDLEIDILSNISLPNSQCGATFDISSFPLTIVAKNDNCDIGDTLIEVYSSVSNAPFVLISSNNGAGNQLTISETLFPENSEMRVCVGKNSSYGNGCPSAELCCEYSVTIDNPTPDPCENDVLVSYSDSVPSTNTSVLWVNAGFNSSVCAVVNFILTATDSSGNTYELATGTTSTNSNYVNNNISLSGLAPGTYTTAFTATCADESECSSTLTDSFVKPEEPFVCDLAVGIEGPTSANEGESVTFTGTHSGGTGTVACQFKFNGLTFSQNPFTTSFGQAGTYPVCYECSDDQGCFDDGCLNIVIEEVNDPPPPDNTCTPGTITLSPPSGPFICGQSFSVPFQIRDLDCGNGTPSITGSYAYGSAGNAGIQNFSNTLNPTFTYQGPGTFTVVVQCTGIGENCATSASVDVNPGQPQDECE